MRIRGFGVLQSLVLNFTDRIYIKFFGFFCPLCQHPCKRYLSLPSHYISDYITAGGKLNPNNSETLNIKNYQCPTCKGADRDRLFFLYLEAHFRKYNSQYFDILDIAPSYPLVERIKKTLNALSIKFNYKTADLYDLNVDDKVDVMDMNIYNNSTFNLLLCSHVLEHVEDDIKAMQEFHRVLSPNGQALLLVPISLDQERTDEDPKLKDEREKICRFGQANHVRQYSKSGFIERLINVGFSVQEVGINQFSKQTFKKYALTKTSCLYVCTKI